jgi:hypothetical protein
MASSARAIAGATSTASVIFTEIVVVFLRPYSISKRGSGISTNASNDWPRTRPFG